MQTLKIHGRDSDSIVLVGARLSELEEYVCGRKQVIITDTNIARLYQKDFPSANIITLGAGEEKKNLDTVKYIYQQLLNSDTDRSTFIVGIGGGVVCDIAGFAASTFMRGLRFGFVATSLLSQVDASVGGKNGVNFAGYKNMIGVFNQPEFVICDPNLLKTLPPKEILSGLAEVIKHAAIADARLFEFLEQNFEKVLQLDTAAVERLVYDSVVIKSKIVNQDEREQGERKKLNFGHTFGHAIEKMTAVSHGEAISVGMAIAAELSVKCNLLSTADYKRIRNLLANFKLPIHLKLDRKMLVSNFKKDKKRAGEMIHFILLNGVGNAVVEKISIQRLTELVNDLNYFSDSL